jgi:uncharacterized protein (DUF305 family)
MSHRIRIIRPSFAACALAIAAATLAFAPAGAGAHEPEKAETPALHGDQMDHSKMDGMSMTGDVDYDFAVNMRKHHQMALDMAMKEVKDGKNPQMIRMGKDIIAAQTKEIAAFDKWMAAHKAPTTQTTPKS